MTTCRPVGHAPAGEGDAGPVPAPVARMAAAISARSSCFSSRCAAGSQPSTWRGDRAPAMAPVTPGKESVQATAMAAGVTPWRSAIGRRADDRARLARRAGEVGVAVPPVARIQAGSPFDAEGAGEQAGGHGAVDDHAGFVLVRPQEHIVGRVTVDQVEQGLDGVHVPDALGRLELADVVVGQSGRGSCPGA
jgi:hypothetical protein